MRKPRLKKKTLKKIRNRFRLEKETRKLKRLKLLSDNIENMINDKSDKVIKELFGSLKKMYQNNLELIKGSGFVFDYVRLLYNKCHKINQNGARSYIDSPDWIKQKK